MQRLLGPEMRPMLEIWTVELLFTYTVQCELVIEKHEMRILSRVVNLGLVGLVTSTARCRYHLCLSGSHNKFDLLVVCVLKIYAIFD